MSGPVGPQGRLDRVVAPSNRMDVNHRLFKLQASTVCPENFGCRTGIDTRSWITHTQTRNLEVLVDLHGSLAPSFIFLGVRELLSLEDLKHPVLLAQTQDTDCALLPRVAAIAGSTNGCRLRCCYGLSSHRE